MSEPLFRRAGERFTPTVFSRGPWDPGLLHGGAVAAMLAEVLLEAADAAYQPVRLTVDLLRPVPLDQLGCDARIVREGRRLQLADAEVRCAGTLVARASLLALRALPLEGEGLNAPSEAPSDGPDDAPERWGRDAETEFFVGGGMTVAFMGGGELGRASAWFHLHRDVFDGTPPSPLTRAAAAADVGGAVSARRSPEFPRISFVNADISVHLNRLPVGEWIRLESASTWEGVGIGTVSGVLADAAGTFGHSNEALVLEVRETDPLAYTTG